MKLKSNFTIDNRLSSSVMHESNNAQAMLVPGASTCTVASSSCSCGAVIKSKK